MKELKANKNQVTIAVYSTPTIAAGIFIFFVTVFVGTAWCSYRGNVSVSPRMRSVVVAAAMISVVHLVFAFAVSSYACVVMKDQPELILLYSPLANIPIMIAVADGLLLVLCIATDILAFFTAIRFSFNHAYIVLGCTIVYASLSILVHCPYIILAYINDAELTGSMFIFYSVSWGLMFLAICRFHVVYRGLMLPCQDRIINYCKHRFNAQQDGPANQGERTPLLHDEERPRASCSRYFCESFFFVSYSMIFCVLILGSVTLLTCYLVVLPITNGLSHLFGHLIDTYHSAILIVGAFVAYKTFFEKRGNQPA